MIEFPGQALDGLAGRVRVDGTVVACHVAGERQRGLWLGRTLLPEVSR